MSWIKVEDFKPPTHEVILFRDRHGIEHYGVLCGECSKKEHRGKFWCHLHQSTYLVEDIIYWCEIPINKNFIREKNEFSGKVNLFLWHRLGEIEKDIIAQFREHQEENPEWPAENFVSIAVRNCVFRMVKNLQVIES